MGSKLVSDVGGSKLLSADVWVQKCCCLTLQVRSCCLTLGLGFKAVVCRWGSKLLSNVGRGGGGGGVKAVV